MELQMNSLEGALARVELGRGALQILRAPRARRNEQSRKHASAKASAGELANLPVHLQERDGAVGQVNEPAQHLLLTTAGRQAVFSVRDRENDERSPAAKKTARRTEAVKRQRKSKTGTRQTELKQAASELRTGA